MIKILQINTVATYSSTGRIVDGIGSSIIREGWESYIAFGRKNGKSASITYKIGGYLSTYLHVLETRLLDKHGLGSRLATKQFINWIKEIQPDIIQLHNLHGYYVNLKILFDYLKESNIPVVMSLHDSWNMTGHCTQFEDIKCEKWKTQCYECPQIKIYPKSSFIDRSFKNHILKKKLFTQITNLNLVTSSKWSAELIKESFLSNYNIDIIPNGVDTSIFKNEINDSLRTNHKLKEKFIILGVAAIWTKNKGFFDFLKISKFLNENEILVMIGLDENQLKNLPSNILGLKRTENIKELANWYSTSDVFFNPTYADTFPTTNLESLACGTPLVTYKTGGSTESVDKTTGFVVEQGNIVMALNSLRKIKSKGKNYYSIACRKKALNQYEKDKQFHEYVKIYKKILSTKKKSL